MLPCTTIAWTPVLVILQWARAATLQQAYPQRSLIDKGRPPRDSLPNESRDSPAPVTQMGLQDPLPGTQVDSARFPNENRHLRSPLMAFEATIKIEDAFTSRLNTPISRPPDDSALSPNVVEDSDDGQPLSPPNEESLKAANRAPYHPGPGLDTSDPIHG
ncbi:MAG: hypothetical protein ASARMPRED_003728 [Alectoria sarmentosa]|nr:MAG: hypothetical protein ASARMPRED_003728 [Alectoria sarmentosa]